MPVLAAGGTAEVERADRHARGGCEVTRSGLRAGPAPGCCRELRRWALAHPQEFALLFAKQVADADTAPRPHRRRVPHPARHPARLTTSGAGAASRTASPPTGR
ncbi:TetR-like C-terminal domain-containing protein [Streptomyces katrae]|uniref:TetR-like C-terminal domain-containing protein n=1 Tax=Streptomyces katrae TaxID=68223 RepID=UPI003306A90A